MNHAYEPVTPIIYGFIWVYHHFLLAHVPSSHFLLPKFNDQIPDYAVPPFVVGYMRPPINRGVYKNGGYPENP